MDSILQIADLLCCVFLHWKRLYICPHNVVRVKFIAFCVLVTTIEENAPLVLRVHCLTLSGESDNHTFLCDRW